MLLSNSEEAYIYKISWWGQTLNKFFMCCFQFSKCQRGWANYHVLFFRIRFVCWKLHKEENVKVYAALNEGILKSSLIIRSLLYKLYGLGKIHIKLKKYIQKKMKIQLMYLRKEGHGKYWNVCKMLNHCCNKSWITQKGHSDLWHGSHCHIIAIRLEDLGVSHFLAS